MKIKLLCLFIIILISGCNSVVKNEDKSFYIPFFNEIVDYEPEDNNNLNTLEEKEYMLLVMNGQIEINKGNNIKAISYFEDSLKIKYSDISYTLLKIYFKENNYLKAKELSELIIENEPLIEDSKKYENLIVYLIHNEEDKYSSIIKNIVSNADKEDKELSDFYLKMNTYKNISDIFNFTGKKPITIKKYLDIDDFTLIEFFYKYNLSSLKGDDPDKALNYLISNKNKNNILHNLAIFKIGEVEKYHIDMYKNEALFIISKLNDYKFEMTILTKFYNQNKKEFEKLKKTLTLKHKDDHNFWLYLSNLERTEIDKSLFNMINSYNIIKLNGLLVQSKDLYIYHIIDLKLKNNDFAIKEYIEDSNSFEDRLYSINKLIGKMIIDDKLDYDYLLSMQPLIENTDINLLISNFYTYFENYDEALIYIDKIEENHPSIVKSHSSKIIALGYKNKAIGLNEAEIYNKESKSIESKLTLLHMKLKNDLDIENGFKKLDIMNDTDDYVKYLKYNYAYKLGKYAEAEKIIKTININDNYIYLLDYGKILWKVNKKEDSIRAFKKSRDIYNSIYLEKTIKELNIEKEFL